MQAFQHEQLSAAQERVAHINRSTPPGLDDKVKEVNQRLEHIVKQTNDRYITVKHMYILL